MQHGREGADFGRSTWRLGFFWQPSTVAMEDSDFFYGLYKTIDKEPSIHGHLLDVESWDTEN